MKTAVSRILLNGFMIGCFFFTCSCGKWRVEKRAAGLGDSLALLKNLYSGNQILVAKAAAVQQKIDTIRKYAQHGSNSFRKQALFTLKSYQQITTGASSRKLSAGETMARLNDIDADLKATGFNDDGSYDYMPDEPTRLVKVDITDAKGNPVRNLKVYARICGNQSRYPNIAFNPTPAALNAIPLHNFDFWYEDKQKKAFTIYCRTILKGKQNDTVYVKATIADHARNN